MKASSMVSKILGASIGFIMLILVVVPVTNQILNSNELPSQYFPIVAFLPLVLVIAIIYGVAGIYLDSKPVSNEEASYYVDTNDIAVEPKTLSVRDAKKILRIRFAKGEISSEEYTERMSRL